MQIGLAERNELRKHLEPNQKVANTKVMEPLEIFKSAPGVDVFRSTFIDAAISSKLLYTNAEAMVSSNYFKE